MAQRRAYGRDGKNRAATNGREPPRGEQMAHLTWPQQNGVLIAPAASNHILGRRIQRIVLKHERETARLQDPMHLRHKEGPILWWNMMHHTDGVDEVEGPIGHGQPPPIVAQACRIGMMLFGVSD